MDDGIEQNPAYGAAPEHCLNTIYAEHREAGAPPECGADRKEWIHKTAFVNTLYSHTGRVVEPGFSFVIERE